MPGARAPHAALPHAHVARLRIALSYCTDAILPAARACRNARPIRRADLAREHGHLLHAIALSADLEWFHHVHPLDTADVADDELRVYAQLPGAGRYALAVDVAVRADAVASCEATAGSGLSSDPGGGGSTTFTVMAHFDSAGAPADAAEQRAHASGVPWQGSVHIPIAAADARALVSRARGLAHSEPVHMSANGAACCGSGEGVERPDGRAGAPASASASPNAAAPCYQLTLSAFAGGGGRLPIDRAIRRGSCVRLRLDLSRSARNGTLVPVRTLRPYLGAAAHLVLVRHEPGAAGLSELPRLVAHGHVGVSAARAAAAGRRLHAGMIAPVVMLPGVPRPPVLGASDWTCSSMDGGMDADDPSPIDTALGFGPTLSAWADVREAGDYRLFVTAADSPGVTAVGDSPGVGEMDEAGAGGERVVTAAFWLRVRAAADDLPASAAVSVRAANATAMDACDRAAEAARCAAAVSRAAAGTQCAADASVLAADGRGARMASAVCGFCMSNAAASSGARIVPLAARPAAPTGALRRSSGKGRGADGARAAAVAVALLAGCICAAALTVRFAGRQRHAQRAGAPPPRWLRAHTHVRVPNNGALAAGEKINSFDSDSAPPRSAWGPRHGKAKRLRAPGSVEMLEVAADAASSEPEATTG